MCTFATLVCMVNIAINVSIYLSEYASSRHNGIFNLATPISDWVVNCFSVGPQPPSLLVLIGIILGLSVKCIEIFDPTPSRSFAAAALGLYKTYLLFLVKEKWTHGTWLMSTHGFSTNSFCEIDAAYLLLKELSKHWLTVVCMSRAKAVHIQHTARPMSGKSSLYSSIE